MAIVDNKLQYGKVTTETLTGKAIGDTLALINQSKNFDTKTMTSTDSKQVYNLGVDLGSTKIPLVLVGLKTTIQQLQSI